MLGAVPYVGPVGQPMGPGVTARIVGSVPVGGRRFHVNFQCGPSINPRDDVAFHLGIDCEMNSITMNNIFANQWGPQEYQNGTLSLQRGRDFTLDIICETNAFQVKLNGGQCAKFEHRVEPLRITHIAIDGDITVHRVEVIGGQVPGGVPIGFAIGSSHAPAPYPTSSLPPYPTSTPSAYPLQTPSPCRPTVPCPQPTNAYPQQPGAYPLQPGTHSGQTHGIYPQQPGAYPQQSHGLYPQQPGSYPPINNAHSPSMQHKNKKGLMDKLGVLTGGAVTGATGLVAMKHMKKHGKLSKKAQKKALKYGLPIAGAGLGVYALKKTHGFGVFHSSSSSSSSSSSDSD